MKTRTIRNPDARSARSRGRRRATALIFAVGVLAVVALISVSYITFVRLDRQSADAVRRAVNYEQQVNAVVNHIGELLAADLFGGAVVTRDVPRFEPNTTLPNWPPMQLTPDYPFTYYGQAGQSFGSPQVSPISSPTGDGNRYILFPPDKSFLASAQPLWVSNQPYWPQITNLRAAWRYEPNGNFQRDDGLFADLGAFFLDTVNIGGIQRPNAGVDFTDSNFAILPQNAAGAFRNPANKNQPASPFLPANFHGNFSGSTAQEAVIRNFDERFFIDTTGDLIPDARWQVLDALGDLFGLRWFVAARVVDASARINYNASIDSGTVTAPDSLADGRTPADIDLYRLLRDTAEPFGSAFGGYPFNNIRVSSYGLGFSRHLRDVLRLPQLFEEIGPGVPGGGFYNPAEWPQATSRLSRQQRTLFWNRHGSSPFDSTTSIPLVYPITEFVEFLAFAGTNNNSLSLVEQMFDGPEGQGFLPQGNDTGSEFYGPLLSRQRSENARRLDTSINDARPSRNTLRYHPRQFLTPYSGVSQRSPIPVLNLNARFDGLEISRPFLANLSLRKVPLNYDANRISDAYTAFVWALAPFATDQFLTYELASQPFTVSALTLVGNPANETFFYGRSKQELPGQSAAQHAIRFGNPADGLEPLPDSLRNAASYSLITAAALAINTRDARRGSAPPTVARLYHTLGNDPILSTTTPGGTVVLGTSFPHGTVPPDLIRANPAASDGELLGRPLQGNASFNFHRSTVQATESQWLADDSSAGGGGVGLTLVGLTRNPYIVEVFTAAVYSNADESGPGHIGNFNEIDPQNEQTQIGSVFAVQIANPYPQQIDLNPYQFRLVNDREDIASADTSKTIAFGFPAGSFVPPNSIRTFAYAIDDFNGQYVGAIAGNAFDPPLYVLDEDDPDDPGPSKLIDLINNESADDEAIQPLLLAPQFQMSLQDKLIVFDDFARGVSGDPIAMLVRTGVGGLVAPASLSHDLPIGAVVDKFTIRTSDLQSSGRIPPGETARFPFVPNGTVAFRGGILENDNAEFFADPSDTNRWYQPSAVPVQDRFNNNEIAGRYLVTSTASRAVRRPNNGGAPAYVFDFDMPGGPASLPVTVRITGFAHAWLTPPGVFPGAVPPYSDPSLILANDGLPFSDLLVEESASPSVVNGSLVASPSGFLAAHTLHRTSSKPADANLADIPSWQLFVDDESHPDGRPLRYLADLHMVSKHAHLCRNNQLTNLNEWFTVGQQLAASLDRDYPASIDPTNIARPNPYLGTLDPSRYIPTDSNNNPLPDHSMSIPLALRVFECFEPLSPIDELVQGRININTAPERVLQMLPYVYTHPNEQPFGLASQRARSTLMLRYRDRFNPESGVYNTSETPLQITGMDFLREGLNKSFYDAPARPLGFASIGELAILHQGWDPNTGTPATATPGFLDVALNPGISKDNEVFAPWGSRTASNPTDDAEKRLALFRTLSNIVSTRSDVFIATFVIRGYDPDIIESIELTGDLENDMNSDEFRPTYESRWLVVYDRSNVRSPVDRPRVLLKAQLAPPAR
ncbi:MAG: hypothetical protein EA380_07250 [Phycisphaeraceae bacterium]|nr:MAG: hypothetical protein EA380_07250 [Phycisphaeraceae bacterium]